MAPVVVMGTGEAEVVVRLLAWMVALEEVETLERMRRCVRRRAPGAVVRPSASSASVSSRRSEAPKPSSAGDEPNPWVSHGTGEVEAPVASACLVPGDRVLDGEGPTAPHRVARKRCCHRLGRVFEVLQLSRPLGW